MTLLSSAGSLARRGHRL